MQLTTHSDRAFSIGAFATIEECRALIAPAEQHGFGGGDTDFRTFRVSPHAGSALLFIHDTWHEGAEVTEGTKYVLRSDVLYGPPA